MSRNQIVLVWISIALFFGITQKYRSQTTHPIVVLVTIDSFNHSFFLSQKNLTPFLGKFPGIQFTSNITPSPNTLPAHSSLFTGLYPYQHGVRANEIHFLSQNYQTLAELFKAQHYSTAAIVSSKQLLAEHQLSQGFSSYQLLRKSAHELIPKATEFLIEHPQKTFLWLQLSDLRSPYTPPDEKFQNSENPYLGSLQYLDQSLGKLFTFLEQEISSPYLLVIAGSYGENFSSRQEKESEYLVPRTGLEVPLFIYSSTWEKKAQKINFPTSLIDLFPTIYHLGIGSELPQTYPIPALDLTPFLQENSLQQPKRWLYFENLSAHLHFGWSPIVGLQNQDWKLIQSTQNELYSQKDEKEIKNEVENRPKVVNQINQYLNHHLKKEPFEPPEQNKTESSGAFLFHNFKKNKVASPVLHINPKEKLELLEEWESAQKLVRSSPEEYAEKMKKLEPHFLHSYLFYRKVIDQLFIRKSELAGVSQRFVQLSITKLSQMTPYDFFAIYYHGLLLHNQKLDTKALEEFLKIIYTYPKEPKSNFLVGSIFFRNNDKRAIPFLTTYLKQSSPQNPKFKMAQQMIKQLHSVAAKK